MQGPQVGYGFFRAPDGLGIMHLHDGPDHPTLPCMSAGSTSPGAMQVQCRCKASRLSVVCISKEKLQMRLLHGVQVAQDLGFDISVLQPVQQAGCVYAGAPQ